MTRDTETLLNGEPPKPKRRTDKTLALANRIDRERETLPAYGQEMILRFLCAKWMPKTESK